MTDDTKQLTPCPIPASLGFFVYRAKSGWLTSIGLKLPKIVLMPDMMLQPSGVVAAAAVPSCETRSNAPRPPPLAMHQPKMAKAAMGIVQPLTVKM